MKSPSCSGDFVGQIRNVSDAGHLFPKIRGHKSEFVDTIMRFIPRYFIHLSDS